MIKTNVRDLKQLTRMLSDVKKKALPHAVRNSLNRSAFHTREVWQNMIEASFVTRNKFTTRSVRVEKANGVKLEKLRAKVGSVADYMDEQERGGTIRGGKHKPIPTSYAAGQMGASPRTKTVRRPNWLGKINLDKAKGRTSRQRNAMAISQARAKEKKYALIETKRGKAIVRVLGKQKRRTRRTKSSGPSKQIRMVYDLSRGSVRVEGAHTLERSLRVSQPQMERFHRDSLLEQLERARREARLR